jgi:hypothetical protein
MEQISGWYQSGKLQEGNCGFDEMRAIRLILAVQNWACRLGTRITIPTGPEIHMILTSKTLGRKGARQNQQIWGRFQLERAVNVKGIYSIDNVLTRIYIDRSMYADQNPSSPRGGKQERHQNPGLCHRGVNFLMQIVNFFRQGQK